MFYLPTIILPPIFLMSFNDVGRHHQILLVSFREILGQGMSPFPGCPRPSTLTGFIFWKHTQRTPTTTKSTAALLALSHPRRVRPTSAYTQAQVS